jgi:uncharacterized membrane protein YbhN (UPF0104 family)
VANFILPVRGGDAVRAYLVRAGDHTSFVTAAVTLGAEKVFDVVSLLVVAGITAAIAPLPGWAARSLGAAAVVGISLAGLFAALPPSLLHQWTRRASERLGRRAGPAFEAIAGNALAGLEALRDRRLALAAGSWSALVWVLAASTNWLVLRALGLHLGLGAALLQLVIHMVPFPAHVPGRVGEHQALSLVGLAPYGVGAVSQVAFATALYAVVFLPQVVLGALSLGYSAFTTGPTHGRDIGDSAGV